MVMVVVVVLMVMMMVVVIEVFHIQNVSKVFPRALIFVTNAALWHTLYNAK